ncbi:cyclin-P3-1 [Artemisia annua]|uniref:Cyclin-P3-1 n=1 Tax=Artemisia annua TaxID=35608 RepID=A0A2U1K981_ARTAN|nr:cyclin-P3-1 [Artemisia annua]
MDATRNNYPCLDIEASTHENDKIYLTLGLTGRTNEKPGTPKVIALLSSILQESVEDNENLLKTTHTKDILTDFHGSRAPTLTIKQYVDRIFRYSRCSPSCFVVAYIYMDRFIQAENIILTSLNVHRLLITSIMVAAKFIDEAFFNNAYYAKVGGVTTAEMNRLEMKFLFGIDFQLYVNDSTFRKYCSELMSGAKEIHIERPLHAIFACGIKDNSSYNPTIGIEIE